MYPRTDGGNDEPLGREPSPFQGGEEVRGTSTTTTGYIEIQDYMTNPSGGYFNPKEPFGTSSTLIIPILPGTIGVYFGNNNLFNGATATITVTYYY